jgi:hypothetical protein
MNPWQAVFFGLKQIPRELTAFEIEAFFTFTATEAGDRATSLQNTHSDTQTGGRCCAESPPCMIAAHAPR